MVPWRGGRAPIPTVERDRPGRGVAWHGEQGKSEGDIQR